jgi:hypothetical protein
MDTNLAKVLVQLGVIRRGTVLEAFRSAKGLSCVCDSYSLTSYRVLGASVSQDHVYFDVVSSPTERYRLRSDYVRTIDGMAIKRVAAAHQLREDGSPVLRRPRKRKRGRLLLTAPV